MSGVVVGDDLYRPGSNESGVPFGPRRPARPGDGWWHGDWWRPVRSIVSLKWGLVSGGARGSSAAKAQLAISVTLSVIFGLAALVLLVTFGRTSSMAADGLVVFLMVSTFGVGLLAAATGVEASLDPRQLASEPLTASQLGVAMLLAAFVGPPALLALGAGAGLFLGWRTGSAEHDALLALIVVLWWITLVVLSRTTANVLGMWATGRFRRLAQAGATAAALLGWVFANLVSRYPDKWNAEGIRIVADVARYTPPGQLAVAVVGHSAQVPVGLVLGVSWLPVLVWGSIVSTRRLVTTSPVLVDSRSMRSGRSGLHDRLGFIERISPGPVGAIAQRSVLTKIRTPRQAVNTVTALVVGGGVMVVGPLLDGGLADPRGVLLGGLLQFVVLFDGNNAFGVDGPAQWAEIQAGADGRDLVRAKILTSVVTVGPFAVLIPTALAAIGNGWSWLPAALLLAAGAVTSAAGVAVVSASYAPVAMPLSANPLAAGDTGQGCVASLMLGIGIMVLVVVTAPFVGLVYFVSGHSMVLTTALAALVAVVGVALMAGCAALAERRLSGFEGQLVDKVTPRR